MNLSGSNLDFLFAFLGGAAISFTPCVYPLLPITVGVIGANTTSRLRGFFLSLIYVSGVAVTYSMLGLAAALTGKLFGKIASHPAAFFIAGAVITLFGLSMLGIFNLPLPKINLQAASGKKGGLSVFLLGVVSGLMVSPCITPALGAILAYVSSRQNLFYGALLLISFAYGMGILLILAGTFSAILAKLPRSGIWIERIKKICGLILVIVGIWYTFSGIRRLQ